MKFREILWNLGSWLQISKCEISWNSVKYCEYELLGVKFREILWNWKFAHFSIFGIKVNQVGPWCSPLVQPRRFPGYWKIVFYVDLSTFRLFFCDSRKYWSPLAWMDLEIGNCHFQFLVPLRWLIMTDSFDLDKEMEEAMRRIAGAKIHGPCGWVFGFFGLVLIALIWGIYPKYFFSNNGVARNNMFKGNVMIIWYTIKV